MKELVSTLPIIIFAIMALFAIGLFVWLWLRVVERERLLPPEDSPGGW
jgi:hypothetical protein